MSVIEAKCNEDEVVIVGPKSTSPAEFVARQVRAFYEHFPCGGDTATDDHRWDRLPWMEDEFELRAARGRLVLDVGCGIGIDMERFLENGATVVGVDIATKPLAHARNRLSNSHPGDSWHLVRADARFLPFKKGAFEFFYSNGVLHHIPQHDRVLRDVRRCLKTGGRGAVLVYHRRSLMTLLTRLIRLALSGDTWGKTASRLLSLDRNPGYRSGYEEVVRHPLIKYFSRKGLAASARAAGFGVTRVTAYDWAFPIRRKTRRKAGLLDRWFGRFLVGHLAKEQEGGEAR